jgi:hypothetical protein
MASLSCSWALWNKQSSIKPMQRVPHAQLLGISLAYRRAQSGYRRYSLGT